MFRMKPETIERRRIEREAAKALQRIELINRLRQKVVEHGFDSIYAEMLADLRNR